MSAPNHAADDGSLARSTGGAAARGALLIAFAIVIGIVLLMFALDDPETEVVSDDPAQVDDEDGAGDDAAAADDGSGVEAVDSDDSGEATGVIDDPADTETETIPEEPIDGPSTARAPAEVNVLVANGVGTAGIAGSTADRLIADGYIGVAADAPNTDASAIFYQPGFDADARAVADVLGATPDVIQPLPADGTIPVNQNAIDDGRAAAANVVVIIGSDGAVPTS